MGFNRRLARIERLGFNDPVARNRHMVFMVVMACIPLLGFKQFLARTSSVGLMP